MTSLAGHLNDEGAVKYKVKYGLFSRSFSKNWNIKHDTRTYKYLQDIECSLFLERSRQLRLQWVSLKYSGCILRERAADATQLNQLTSLFLLQHLKFTLNSVPENCSEG